MSKVEIPVPFADGDEYVMMPGCCYDGNRFHVLKKEYPPMFTPEEASIDMPVTITDVPRLEMDGSGCIEVTSGDLSVPCVGVFHQVTGRGMLVFTVQQVAGENIGLAYRRGHIILTAPAVREQLYRWPHMVSNTLPRGKEKDEAIPYRTYSFDCETIEAFFEAFFRYRKSMGLDDTRAHTLSFAEQFDIQREKWNRMNWHEEEGFYDVDTRGEWQPGWVGGAMTGYALMKLGGQTEHTRAVRTLEFLFRNQSPSGLFYGLNNKKCDGFRQKGAEKWLLVRKSADCLYFLFKHFSLMAHVPKVFEEGAI